MPLRGSCPCGAISYEVDLLDMPIGHCHCATCRKAHASAFTTTAGVMRRHFRLTAGEDKLRAHESSPGKLRCFCGECGTHLVAHRPAQPHVILRVATLDDDPQTKPVMHIWISQAVPWLVDEGEVPRYAEWPTPAEMLGKMRQSCDNSQHFAKQPKAD